jgi:hypothetical protein
MYGKSAPVYFQCSVPDSPEVKLVKIGETLADSDQLLSRMEDVEGRGRCLLADLGQSSTEKLDVADLVELDRALQAFTWVEAIRSAGKQLDEIWCAKRGIPRFLAYLRGIYTNNENRVVRRHAIRLETILSLLSRDTKFVYYLYNDF